MIHFLTLCSVFNNHHLSGLDNVKAKSDRRRERKRRAKERRAAAQRGGSGEAGRVETEASKKMGDNRDPVEIVEYIDPRKLRQKKRSDKAIPKVSADQPVLVSMKDARFSVFKFGLSGLAAKEKEDAEVAALVRLGAKPPKKPGVNYKELKETRKLEKEEEKKRKELQRVSGMGSKRKSKKGGKDSEGPPTKKKKRGGESLQTKVGKFNGGMLKLSSKDLAKIKK